MQSHLNALTKHSTRSYSINLTQAKHTCQKRAAKSAKKQSSLMIDTCHQMYLSASWDAIRLEANFCYHGVLNNISIASYGIDL